MNLKVVWGKVNDFWKVDDDKGNDINYSVTL
jgi:hypothetical protein